MVKHFNFSSLITSAVSNCNVNLESDKKSQLFCKTLGKIEKNTIYHRSILLHFFII